MDDIDLQIATVIQEKNVCEQKINELNFKKETLKNLKSYSMQNVINDLSLIADNYSSCSKYLNLSIKLDGKPIDNGSINSNNPANNLKLNLIMARMEIDSIIEKILSKISSLETESTRLNNEIGRLQAIKRERVG